MIDLWHKLGSDGQQVFYRVEGNPTVGFISMATVEGKPTSHKVPSKERPTRADVEEQFASYVLDTEKTGS